MEMKIPKVNFYIATFMGVFMIALGINTLYQAKLQYIKTSSKIKLAVFLDASPDAPLDVIRERLVNLDGIAGLNYFAPEKALEKALKETPDIKEILIGADNPFPSYFLVTPKNKSPGAIEYLRESITAMDGIDEVRFDANLVNISAKINNFIEFYVKAIKLMLLFCVLLMLAKIGWAIYRGTADYRRYMFLGLSGIVTGFAASAVYYVLVTKILHSPLAAMPLKYVAFLIPCGILLSFIWDNK
ncbi:MAG: permease-like cell division protein FtsX [Elusimicrobiota bacterium]